MSDGINLFPQDPIRDDDDDDGDGDEYLYEDEPNIDIDQEVIEDILSDDAARDFEGVFRAMAGKVLWEMFMSLINPDDSTRRIMIEQIIRCGYSEIEDQLNKECEDMDEHQMNVAVRCANRGLSVATSKFRDSYNSKILVDKFLNRVRSAVKSNLEK